MKKHGMSFIYVQLSQNGPAKQINFEYGSIFESDNGRRFRVQGAIKQGGNGVVFDAAELDLSGSVIQQCAVKCLKQLSTVRRDRFANEVRIHQVLDSPQIAAFHGSGMVELGDEEIEVPWSAMSLGGKNLREIVPDDGLDVATAINVCTDATMAIMHLHAKDLIHRDIKPENFVQSMHWQVSAAPCQMIDFGIAKYIGEDVAARPFDQFTKMYEFVGPQNFASPELIQYGRDKETPVDQKSDYFQLGLLLWFVFTGKVLAGIPAKRLDRTGGKLHALVCDLVQELPEDRPSSLDEVLSRLKEL
jgi:serine/threonine protein kinase